MIKLNIENGIPVGNIYVYSFVDFAKTMLDLYESHKYIENDMTCVDNMHVSYSTQGWSSLYGVINIKSYYTNTPVERFTVYFGFVECDDEDNFDFLHQVIDKYFDSINYAKRECDRYSYLKSFARDIENYYGDC